MSGQMFSDYYKAKQTPKRKQRIELDDIKKELAELAKPKIDTTLPYRDPFIMTPRNKR